MIDCLFCKIVEGEIPSEKVYEDEHFLAFKDINPKAPVHILIIPKEHISRVENLEENQVEMVGRLILLAKDIAHQQRIKNGFRLIFNNGPDAGQAVEHIHLHLLGGRKLTWPPG
ncbi:MAG: histidine triad nucleotide-binding protein [Candidatus Marinimicrobia bacterium]|nr:histidine triad nucleotide-binding protein [Candidatus Neomarinimicrobiota bacterium]MDD5582220.1 histidine triad nucleotide-binding protein [Candidatus Neomarinimicrobiota bacterium]